MKPFGILFVCYSVASFLLVTSGQSPRYFTEEAPRSDERCNKDELEKKGYDIDVCTTDIFDLVYVQHSSICIVNDIHTSLKIFKQCSDGVWTSHVTDRAMPPVRRKRRFFEALISSYCRSIGAGCGPPKFTSNCPPRDLDKVYSVSQRTMTTRVRWTAPSATEDFFWTVKSIQQTFGPPNGGLFRGSPEGITYRIEYTATNNFNQKATCLFTFKVKVGDCDNPDGIDHGHVSYTNTFSGSTAIYTCFYKYRLEGSYSRTCTKPYYWHSYTWSGQKPSCEYNYCSSSQPCRNGGQCRDITGGYRCFCQAEWRGRQCETRISCGYPDNIDNGIVSYPNTYYGATTTYSCNNDYKLTGGSHVRTCTANSVWSGTKPSCVYANHCASKPCQNGATCTDRLGDYQCRCQSGWSGRHCEQDTQAPVMSKCPSDQTVYTTTHTLHINWTEPTFVDPMGKDIRVTANYQTSEFTFPWGDFTVQHVATKPSNGLKTECSFQIHVRPTPCDDLNIPVHGARVCNGWKTDYGRFCLVTCQTSYTIDPTNHSYDTLYVCGASGNWTASSPLPDCKIHMSDVASIKAIQPSYPDYSYNLTCNEPASKLAIQTLYINTITADESFKGFCSKYADECVPQNVQVDC